MTIAPASHQIAFPRDIDLVIDALQAARLEWRGAHDRHTENGVHFPSRRALERILRELGAALFPLRLGPPELTARNENGFVAATLESVLSQLGAQIGIELRVTYPEITSIEEGMEADRILGAFAAQLPDIRRRLDADLEAAFDSDPAATSVDELLFSYPSIAAVIHHRLAHALHVLGAPLVARIIAELAHGQTGVDIHPGATIGRSFFIDHGTGVVIGETAVIGHRVRLYQGVTLGGEPHDHRLTAAPDARPRRHPLLEDDVVIYPGTAIIGPVTIGARTRIDGNLWIRRDVPADTIVSAPEPRITASAGAVAAP
jgi:serine O-acetyltransferase